MGAHSAGLNQGSGMPRQFLGYVAVGAIGTGVHYLILALLVAAGWHPTLATATGATAGAIVNYALNYRYTFRSRRAHRIAAKRYLAVTAVGWLLNAGLFHGLHQLAGEPLWLAQIVTTLLVLGWNFAGNRWWTFGGQGDG